MRELFEEWMKLEYSCPDLEYTDNIGCYVNLVTQCLFIGFCHGYWRAENGDFE